MRGMIEIVPGTAGWDAWLKHHRGSKTELVMLSCREQARPFFAWTETPPGELALLDRGNMRKVVDSEPSSRPERGAVADGEVDAVAARLERRAADQEAEASARERRAERGAKTASAFERAAEAVRGGWVPNLKGLDDIGVVMIDDPSEMKMGSKAPPQRAKLVNLRDDPVGQMEKRGQIETEQLAAARKWQALYDTAASIGGSRGIDPSAMKVDGGRFGEPINDVQIYAIKELERIDVLLGCVGASLVRHVLGERRTVGQVAGMMGNSSALGLKHTGHRFRECLDTLVAIMGVDAKGRRRRAPRDEPAELARYADNPLLYQAVHHAMTREPDVEPGNRDKPTLSIKIV